MLFLFVLPYALQQDFYKEVGLPKSIFFAYMQNFFLSDKDNGILMQVVRPTWSLAVEEHFYLIWPAVIYYTRENKLQKILIALVISAILSRLAIVAGSNLSTIILRYWTTTWTVCRIDSLLIGALLAIALRCHAQRMLLERWRWALLIILVLLNALFMVLKYVSFLNYSLYALFFAAVINLVLFLPKKSWVVRIFDNGFFRSCGKYSYCMYLFHLPIMLLVVRNLAGISNYGLTGVFLLFTSSTLLVWLFAWSSWNLYEKHFLDLKRRFEQIDEKGEVDVDAASQELPICTSDGELR
jgi:peptidoglycan/LPS O-acetylase OafA/YrhL